MDSEAKPGRTTETPLAVLQAIKERLRPVLLRAWRRSTARAIKTARESGMSEREYQLYLEGFQQGWVSGALDVTRVSPADLPDQGSPEGTPSGVH